MNPLKQLRNFRESLKLSALIESALEELPYPLEFLDCDAAAESISSVLNRNGFKTTRVSIVSEPRGQELGHIMYRNQYQHEVLLVNGRIIDPHYNKLLPLEDYTKSAYRPKEGVKIVAIQHE